MNFYDLMGTLARMGVWDIILPFMLIFTIVYATLTSTIYSGDERKKFATILSLVIAFGVIIPHAIGAYPRNADVVEIINTALPNVALITVGILGLFILLGMFGIELKLQSAPILWVIILLSVGAIIYVFGSAGGSRWQIPRWLGFLGDSDTQALLIVVIVFGILIKVITGGGKSGGETNKKSVSDVFENISKLFKGD